MRSLHCQLATLADDLETALLRAAKADSEAGRLREEAEACRQAASEAAATAKVCMTTGFGARICSVLRCTGTMLLRCQKAAVTEMYTVCLHRAAFLSTFLHDQAALEAGSRS